MLSARNLPLGASPVSAEVIATEAEAMVEEAELAAIAPQIVTKIPMTPDGLQAVKH